MTETLTITAANFMSEVVEASTAAPVLVDFWAPWCAPCRQLLPILDRLAKDYGGRLKIAKVNTDEQQELAQQIGIRSLPTVVLFKDGTAAEHFVGVLPEAQIREMLERHLDPIAESPLQRARALKSVGEFSAARELLAQALTTEPSNVEYQIEAAELQALDGDLDGARQELSRLKNQEPNHSGVKRLAALLTFSDVIAAYPDVKALHEKVAADPSDLGQRHALAVHQLLGGDVQPALATWLDIMRTNRSYKDDLARRSLVQAFELIGETDPIVGQTRRAMTQLLF